MNKQEIEMAIEIIASDKKAFEAVNHGGFTNKIKAFKSAISALEKQISKKPRDGSRAVIAGIDGANCGNCGGLIFMPNDFCGKCGQAIDWRNEDE